jgi:hypothetical protein
MTFTKFDIYMMYILVLKKNEQVRRSNFNLIGSKKLSQLGYYYIVYIFLPLTTNNRVPVKTSMCMESN